MRGIAMKSGSKIHNVRRTILFFFFNFEVEDVNDGVILFLFAAFNDDRVGSCFFSFNISRVEPTEPQLHTERQREKERK